jgi:hypothetical protein
MIGIDIRVDIFVDPICPFAWLTSRWLFEVERVRPVIATVRIMSLSVLNDGREELSEFYRNLLADGWAPARVAIAVETEHGPDGLRRFNEAFGKLHHLQRLALGNELLVEALERVGLPKHHADAAASSEWDFALRASHELGVQPVGDEVGTPILHIRNPHNQLRDNGEPLAIFGPVVTPAPRGEAAGQLWDGVLNVASCNGFFELKRTRVRPLEFT